jgi:hypothetical protein
LRYVAKVREPQLGASSSSGPSELWTLFTAGLAGVAETRCFSSHAMLTDFDQSTFDTAHILHIGPAERLDPSPQNRLMALVAIAHGPRPRSITSYGNGRHRTRPAALLDHAQAG